MLETLQPTMKLNRRDSVVVALTPIPKQTQLTIDQQTITTLEDIPQGHKIALGDLKAGDNVIKYGDQIWLSNRSCDDRRNCRSMAAHS